MHLRDPAVAVGHDDVEPDHRGSAPHSVISTFGAPHDVTLAELALETFLPADDATRAALTTRAGR